MAIHLPHLQCVPVIPASCYVDPSARINGDVKMGEQCSVWFHVAIRGDVNRIRVGHRTNIQDHGVLHTTFEKHDLCIGDDVSLGHGVIVHGCRIGDRVLVGMGSIIMDGAVIGNDVLIGAGSLVTEHTRIPDGMLAFGRPARMIRPLRDEEVRHLARNSARYVEYMEAYRGCGQFTSFESPEPRG